jgi:hypothetical protein
MRIPVLIISAASLVALGGIAKADDHLFQATEGGLSEDSTAFDNTRAFDHDSPGRGSPFTSFPNNTNEQGVPSADPEETQSGHGEHDLPANAGPKE